MTIIGIAGCSALLVAGFGINDSISNIVNQQYNVIYHYDATVSAKTSEITSQIESLKGVKDVYEEDHLAVTTKIENKDISTIVHIISNNKKFKDFCTLFNGNKEFDLDDSSVLISQKMATKLNKKAGDTIKIKDIEIVALDSFDRTCITTTDSQGPDREDLRGKCPTDMDDKAVNYLVKTPGGNIYHSGDSHYSIYYAKHGKDYDIDVAFGSYGENPVGMQDKMTSVDILRMAEALRTDVVIPIHYDVWTNFKADPKEIELLYNYKKDVLDYKFHPFIWDVGGKYVYPTDKAKRQFHYRRGFEDCFEEEPNVPYRSVL